MTILIAVLLLLAFSLFIYMRLPEFGKNPTGKRLELISKSSNYRDGKFQNIHNTPQLTEGYSFFKVLLEYFFSRPERLRPVDRIPSVKTDLLHLSADQDVLVWFGHSSYFMQIAGKRILVDPVLYGSSSPVPGGGKSFNGTDIYTAADFPEIDYLFISHDHYDHLDYETMIHLKSKVKKVICGLGVGEHLEHWGYPVENIIEKDWNQEVNLGDGFVVHTTSARHFSGRGLSGSNTLWMSYVLQTPKSKIYIGGDSGYDTHFAEIGKKYGPIDLAILENGQYDLAWRYIHMLPEEVLQAAKDLKAKRLFPVHSSKFVLGNHAWDEPLTKITELNEANGIPLVTPLIGEQVNLADSTQTFTQWWKGLK